MADFISPEECPITGGFCSTREWLIELYRGSPAEDSSYHIDADPDESDLGLADTEPNPDLDGRKLQQALAAHTDHALAVGCVASKGESCPNGILSSADRGRIGLARLFKREREA